MEDPYDRRQAYLTVGQVAERLNLCNKSVYALIRAGALLASNVGLGKTPRYRIRPDVLEAFLAAGSPK